MDKSEYLEFTKELATSSEAVIRRYFAQPDLKVELKADETVVTRADREAEQVMRDMIAKRFPEHGIWGEEHGKEQADAEFVWVLDPIDGTKSFVAGNAQFGTLICLLHQGKPIVGAINLAATQQLLLGDGKQTTLNGHPVRVREAASLEDLVICTTDLDNPGLHQDNARWDQLVNRSKKLYTWGDCYAYYLLATGGCDMACDPVMNPWDLLALIPVIEGAGGVITDWQGKDPAQGESIVAAHPRLHGEIIAALNA